MDFAFSALLIFVIVLPGIILRYAYLRGIFSNTPFVIASFTDEIGYGIVTASVLHAIWLSIARLAGHPVDLSAVLTLLIGPDSEHPEHLAAAISETSRSAPLIALYFLSLYACAAVVGTFGHEIVRRKGWDLRYPVLRFSNPWYYLVSGEYSQFTEHRDKAWGRDNAPDFVYLSTVVMMGDEAYLYRGLVADYEFNSAGRFDKILLHNAVRRKLSADRDPLTDHNPANDERFYPIVGDLFIIKYSEMRTINIHSWSVDATTAPPTTGAAGNPSPAAPTPTSSPTNEATISPGRRQ